MPKKKTTVVKEPPAEKEDLCKCYISRDVAGKIDGSGDGTGESFWINKLSPTRAEVRNNCLCGLCVRDIIEIVENGPNGWKNEVVSVVERQSEPYTYKYDFPDMENSAKFPKECSEFISNLQNKGIRFEGMVKGLAMLSRPKTMTVNDFEENLKGGPITFTPFTE